jgi:hypothetical protein
MGWWDDCKLWSDSPKVSFDPQTGKEREEPGTSTLKTTTMRIIFALLVTFVCLFFGFLYCYYFELRPRCKKVPTSSDSESFM